MVCAKSRMEVDWRWCTEGVCNECRYKAAIESERLDRKGERENVCVSREDLAAVLDFVIGWYPGYEDAISWPPSDDGGEYEWMQAARRLRQVVEG